MGFLALVLLLAKAIRWERKELFPDGLYHTTCCLQHIRRRIKRSSRVSPPLRCTGRPNLYTEAAIDANAPLEDEEDGNGPIDSDEELAAVQYGLANWAPQPVVPPLISIPIERQYQKQRLREQMMNATNGGIINIFKVKGFGAQKLRPDHPHLLEREPGDAEGEAKIQNPLSDGMAAVAARRASGFNMQLPPQRKSSGNIQRV